MEAFLTFNHWAGKKKFLHRSPVELISQRIKRNGTYSHTCVVGSMISSQKPYFVTLFVRLITSERQWELEEQSVITNFLIKQIKDERYIERAVQKVVRYRAEQIRLLQSVLHTQGVEQSFKCIFVKLEVILSRIRPLLDPSPG